jgi:hypothetical protein
MVNKSDNYLINVLITIIWVMYIGTFFTILHINGSAYYRIFSITVVSFGLI